MTSLKLGCKIPQLHDVTSLYRAVGPLSDLRRQWNLTTHHLQVWNWATISECDAIFMQRPHTSDDITVMSMAKDVGVPVWIDYDDLLIDVPTDNPTYFGYMGVDSVSRVKVLLENCDHLTVSTNELATRLKRYAKGCPKVTVIPNAINLKWFRRGVPSIKRSKVFSWRGSKTHHRDVFERAMDIAEAQHAHKEWSFHFIGDPLWCATDNMVHERTVIMPAIEWPDFFRHLWKLSPSCMLAPLHLHPFNLCKSNIAWIEAAFAGCPTIAPDWPEWNRPGVLTYKDSKTFRANLDAVCRGEVDVVDLGRSAWEYVVENLDLAKVNLLRRQVLESMV